MNCSLRHLNVTKVSPKSSTASGTGLAQQEDHRTVLQELCFQIKEGFSHFLSLRRMLPLQGHRRAQIGYHLLTESRNSISLFKQSELQICTVIEDFFFLQFYSLFEKKKNVTYNNVCESYFYCTFYNGAIELVLCFLRVQ